MKKLLESFREGALYQLFKVKMKEFFLFHTDGEKLKNPEIDEPSFQQQNQLANERSPRLLY